MHFVVHFVKQDPRHYGVLLDKPQGQIGNSKGLKHNLTFEITLMLSKHKMWLDGCDGLVVHFYLPQYTLLGVHPIILFRI